MCLLFRDVFMIFFNLVKRPDIQYVEQNYHMLKYNDSKYDI
jgi:hypothetical protein